MDSELSVAIKVSSRNENFRWDNLRNSWQTAFKGEISEPKRSRGRWTFTWTGADCERVLEHAEKGLLDRKITSEGGSRLMKIIEDQKCIYEAIRVPRLSQRTRFRDVGVNDLQKEAQYVDLLLMTVTDIERKAVLSEMDPWPGQEEILVGAISQNTYRFGQFGRYRAAQVESTMGGSGRHGAQVTLQNAITELQPKAILLIGIAFGINPGEQHLGDVIIGEAVFNYELERIGDPQSILRGEETKCGSTLSNCFRTRRQGWKLRGRQRVVNVHQGLLLSGPKLIDNKEFLDQLVGKFANRQPLGGEMEGAGAYEVAETKGIEVILIKGICDWADGHKNDRAQPFAAYSAVSLAKHVLSKPDVLAPLGAKDVPDPPSYPSPHPPDKRYELIVSSLKHGSLVPFLGSGVNPDFYIDLASQFAKVLEKDIFSETGTELLNEREQDTTENERSIESLKRQELIKKLIGIPCSVCPYWVKDRPEECPIIKDIEKSEACCPLRIEQELAVSKINLRYLSDYHMRTHSLIDLYYKLYETIQTIKYNDSQVLHQFLATLPRLMFSRGYPIRSPGLPYQLIVTTNYDDMLEKAFSKAQQLYDVVFYVADGDDRGKFKHKSCEGDVQTIDTPDYDKLPLRTPLDDAIQPRPIILKLFGTCDQNLDLEPKFVATEQQLNLMLDNLARNLPTSLVKILRGSSILFMGYSPRDTDLNRIVHCLWPPKNPMRNKSCLLHQAQPGDLEQEIWNSRKVELIKIPTSLDGFVTELKEVIDAQIPVLEGE